jgi:hypothetical protein
MPKSEGVGIDLDSPQGLPTSGQGRLNRTATSFKSGMPREPKHPIECRSLRLADETLSGLDLGHPAW